MNHSITSRFTRTLAAAVTFGALALTSVASQAETIKGGAFEGRSDHITTGAVTVEKVDGGLVVRLGKDFSLDGAPDPKVGFGKAGKYDTAAQVGHLASKTGEQTYQIPASVNVDQYDEVYIWCEQFSVPLGVAKIQ